MNNLRVKTDGNLHGSEVYDEAGNCLGSVSEVLFVQRPPLTLVKVGTEDSLPTKEDLDEWRKVFEDAEKNGDFKIFTHPHITIERIDNPKGPVVVESKVK